MRKGSPGALRLQEHCAWTLPCFHSGERQEWGFLAPLVPALQVGKRFREVGPIFPRPVPSGGQAEPWRLKPPGWWCCFLGEDRRPQSCPALLSCPALMCMRRAAWNTYAAQEAQQTGISLISRIRTHK